MDKSESRQIVNDNIRWLRWAMGLQEWQIDIEQGRCSGEPTYRDETKIGQCLTKVEYRQATIEINPECIDDRDKLLFVLRHELLHILHAENQLHRDQVNACAPEASLPVLDEAWKYANERLVGNMERMLDAMGLNPDRMIELARAELENHQPEAVTDDNS